MQKNLFNNFKEDSIIFKNKEVFTVNYIPEIYKYRNHQLEAMAFYSKRVEQDIAPSNMMLKGNNATGKTTTVKTYFKLISEAYNNVKCIYINCQHYRTEYTILSKIYKEIINTNITLSGLTTLDIYNEIMEYVLKNKKILIIAFDDYGFLKNINELNKTFYSLSRAHETFDDVKISIIAISSIKRNINLDSSVDTIFLPIEIKFPFYRYEEIFSILKQRCDLGFYCDVINDNILDKVVKNTFRKGNLRYGIKKLLELGEIADRKDETKIEF
ncbi:AAA family ATPase [Methanobrevibacter sp. DSM 116169]|uniref:AAA family ATPase n=1 Tax=Methanobrevibacter sp. DSM 116169 TaxID=3242727 RepID=UPI0038FC11F5